jgi:cation:H+ antiporter
LAVSDILGGNAVLPGLLVLVTLLSGRSAFAAVDPTSLLLCGLGTVMTAACAGAMAMRSQRRLLGVGIDGLVVLGVYGAGIAGVAMLAP